MDAVVAVLQVEVFPHQIGAEVATRPLDFPGLVFFGPGHDLPEVAVVPHEFTASQQGAALHRDACGIGGDVALAALRREAVHADDGTGNAVGFDVAEKDVMRAAGPGCGDLDGTGVGGGFPGILLPRRVEDLTDKFSAMPGKVMEIGAGEENDSGRGGQRFGKMETGSVG